MSGVIAIDPVNAAYFRYPFTLDDAPGITSCMVKLKYDDGAVVYLNGGEIKRINMSSDSVSYQTKALQAKKAYEGWYLDQDQLSLLKSGQNLLAVKIHQFNDAALDMYFNCSLIKTAGAILDTLINYNDEWQYFDLGQSPQEFTKGSLNPIQKKTLDFNPQTFRLEQNYPNPFNPKKVISYLLSVVSKVEMSVYNLVGQKVATLVSGRQTAGQYKVEWDAANFASGVYFYQLSATSATGPAGNFAETKKLILLK